MKEASLQPRRLRFALLSCLGLFALGLAIYQPWTAVPLDATDFSELIPVFRKGDTFLARLESTLRYYADHGRLNPVNSVFLTVNWELWNSWAQGWRFIRALVMGVVILEVIWLLRTFHFSRLGAVVGASLFVVTLPAAEGWIRATAEPLALLFFLWSLHLSNDYQCSARYRSRLCLILGLTLLMILTKEVMIALVPVIAFAGFGWGKSGALWQPEVRTRNAALLIGMVAILGLTTAAMGWVLSGAGTEAYARGYGFEPGVFKTVPMRLGAILVPLPSGGLPAAIGVLGFLALLVGGCTIRLWQSSDPVGSPAQDELPEEFSAMRESAYNKVLSRPRFQVLVGLVVPVLGVLVYLPWPRFEPFYVLPFLMGTSLLLAGAATGLELVPRMSTSIVAILVGLVLLPSALRAFEHGQFQYSLRIIHHELATDLPNFASRSRILFAVRGTPEQPWQGRGPTLRRHAKLLNPMVTTIPPARDTSCSAVAGMRGGGLRNVVLMSYGHWCGRLSEPAKSYTSVYRYFTISKLAVRQDTAVIDVVIR